MIRKICENFFDRTYDIKLLSHKIITIQWSYCLFQPWILKSSENSFLEGFIPRYMLWRCRIRLVQRRTRCRWHTSPSMCHWVAHSRRGRRTWPDVTLHLGRLICLVILAHQVDFSSGSHIFMEFSVAQSVCWEFSADHLLRSHQTSFSPSPKKNRFFIFENFLLY